jgi:hypothetical protein
LPRIPLVFLLLLLFLMINGDMFGLMLVRVVDG